MKKKKQSKPTLRGVSRGGLVRDFTRTELFEDAKLIYKEGQPDERELIRLTCAALANMVRDRVGGR